MNRMLVAVLAGAALSLAVPVRAQNAPEKKSGKRAEQKKKQPPKKKPQAQSPKMNSDWNRFNDGMSRQEKKDAAKNAPKAKSP